MQNSSQQIKYGAILSYVSIIINIVSGLLYTPWMIGTIGQENFGLYILANSVITLFVFDFGLSAAVTRFIARYVAEGKQIQANNCLGLVYRLYFSLDVMFFIGLSIIYFLIPQIYKDLSIDEIEKFKVVYAIAAIYSVLSFPFLPLNGVLAAHEKFIQLKICDVIHKILIVALMSFCLLMGWGLYALVLCNAISGILTICFKSFCIMRFSPQKISWKYFNREEIKILASYSGWVTVISLAQRCIFSIAPSILGVFSGSTAIAVLGIAITIENYIFTFAHAINGLFLPRVTKIVAKENGNVLPLMIKIGRIQIYIVSLVVFGFMCLGDDFIQLWVGGDFSDSYICAVLIILPSFFQLPQLIGNETIYASNKVRKLAIVFIIMAMVNLFGAFLLAPYFGAKGVCISICIAYFIRTIGMDIIFYKDLNIDVLFFFKKTFVSLFFPIFCAVFLGMLLITFITSYGWFSLCLKGGVFVLSYLSIVYLFAMNKFEKGLIANILSRKNNNVI